MRVSSKNQIALPAEARRQLNIKSGDTLIVEVVGGQIVLIQEPKDWAAFMEGLGKEVWEGVNPHEYIDELRGPWPE
ncbi:MAG: AbrB/MazE/SpoVT family DNA-binding domain-containing protein [Acidimicrobiia bacterium]